MKKSLLFIFLMFLITFISFSNEKVRNVSSIKILVLPFFCGEGINKEYSTIANEAFSIAISKSKKFEIVSTKTEQLLKKNEFGEVEQKSSDPINTELARFYGAKIVFTGTINEIDGAYSVIIKGTEIDTKLLRYSERGMCANQVEIISIVESIAYKMTKMTPEQNKESFSDKNILSFNDKSSETDIIAEADNRYRNEADSKYKNETDNKYKNEVDSKYKNEADSRYKNEADNRYKNEEEIIVKDTNTYIKDDIDYSTSFNGPERMYIRNHLNKNNIVVFDTDVMKKLHKKYMMTGNALLGWGIALSVLGQISFASLVALCVFYPIPSYYKYEYVGLGDSGWNSNNSYSSNYKYIQGGKIALSITTPILLLISVLFMPLSAVPYWHARKIKKIAIKANGGRSWSLLENTIPFIDCSNENIGFGLSFKI